MYDLIYQNYKSVVYFVIAHWNKLKQIRCCEISPETTGKVFSKYINHKMF